MDEKNSDHSPSNNVETESKCEDIVNSEDDVKAEILQNGTDNNNEGQHVEDGRSHSKNAEVEGGGDKSSVEDIDDDDEKDVDVNDPNVMYERALRLDQLGKRDSALAIYIKCLSNLQTDNNFKSLPQCLHKVADIYYWKEDYDKAVQFIQAEKMYYETALIDIAGLHKKMEEAKSAGKSAKTIEPSTEEQQNTRAEEYENLARTCLEKKQPYLALEYQGKATKIRQSLYGDTHPITKKSLDFFTVVYGEVGKQQYSDSMQKLSVPDNKESSEAEKAENTDGTNPGVRQRKTSILRNPMGITPQRSRNDSVSKQVQFDEETIAREASRQKEENVSRVILWALVILISVVMSIILFYTYCRLHTGARSCRTFRTEWSRYIMKLKYLYYHYTNGGQGNVG